MDASLEVHRGGNLCVGEPSKVNASSGECATAAQPWTDIWSRGEGVGAARAGPGGCSAGWDRVLHTVRAGATERLLWGGELRGADVSSESTSAGHGRQLSGG